MSQITTHILDTSLGKPAQNVQVTLYQQNGLDWKLLAKNATNLDGRVTNFIGIKEALPAGIYKLHFETQTYFDALAITTFYPFVEIVFQINNQSKHYHVPLLLNPFGYSTYRGS